MSAFYNRIAFRWSRWICSFIIFFSSLPSYAGTIEDIDAKEFCSGDGAAVSKMVFARAIVDAYKLPVKIVDWKDTGIGYDEYANIVSTPLCPGGMKQGKCGDDKN